MVTNVSLTSFNSTLVQLKATIPASKPFAAISFNSTLVQLKDQT